MGNEGTGLPPEEEGEEEEQQEEEAEKVEEVEGVEEIKEATGEETTRVEGDAPDSGTADGIVEEGLGPAEPLTDGAVRAAAVVPVAASEAPRRFVEVPRFVEAPRCVKAPQNS